MKIKNLILVWAAALTLQVAFADSTTNNALNTLVKEVSTKIKDGKNTEAALAPELAQFDALIAAQNGAKTDDAAQIVYMKAMLYLQVFENNDKAAELMKDLHDNYGDTKYGKNAGKVLEKITQRSAAQKVQASLAPGKEFPDFDVKDLDGKPLSVGALKGKVVLVDFWATWCGPCRAELPNVIEAYKKYHAQGFEIIGVSLDSDRAKLDTFLKQQEGMTWPQYFDGEGWSNLLAEKYGVQSIPFTVLIGPDGKVLGNDLRGALLAPAIANALVK